MNAPAAISTNLEEPLVESAALAQRLAAALCAGGFHGVAESCAWYHALYPSLRLLDLAPTPERHAAFYLDVLGSLARGGGYERVAITGTADTGMLGLLLRAYRAQGASPRVEVVDRCATPLRLCARYATRVAADVRTTVSDVLRWEPGARFDLVTTHALIGMFPHARQAELAVRWRRVLRAGGKLVSVARVDPSWSPDRPGFSESQAAAFSALVLRRARAGRGLPLGGRAALAERARVYARRMRSFPFDSPGALAALLEGAGLAVDRLDLVRLEGNAGAGESGPGTHRPGTFAHFVATAVA